VASHTPTKGVHRRNEYLKKKNKKKKLPLTRSGNTPFPLQVFDQIPQNIPKIAKALPITHINPDLPWFQRPLLLPPSASASPHGGSLLLSSYPYPIRVRLDWHDTPVHIVELPQRQAQLSGYVLEPLEAGSKHARSCAKMRSVLTMLAIFSEATVPSLWEIQE